MDERIREALDRQLSGVRMQPATRAKVLAEMRTLSARRSGVRRVSIGILVALIALLVTVGTAMAFRMGLFAYFSQRGNGVLALTDGSAQTDLMSATVPAADGFPEARLTVDQAYYDGEYLSLAYALNCPDVLISGAVSERPVEAQPAQLDSDAIAQLEQSGVWQALKSQYAANGCASVTVLRTELGDGALTDGDVYIELMQGGEERRAADTVVGFRQFGMPLPESARMQDELALDLMLLRIKLAYWLDDTGLYVWNMGMRTVLAPVSIRRNDSTSAQDARGTFDDYAVQATLRRNSVSIWAQLELTPPNEWLAEDVDAREVDYICGYVLYSGGERYEPVNWYAMVDGDRLDFMLVFALPDGVDEYRLRPVYAQTGEHPAEDICFEVD